MKEEEKGVEEVDVAEMVEDTKEEIRKEFVIELEDDDEYDEEEKEEEDEEFVLIIIQVTNLNLPFSLTSLKVVFLLLILNQNVINISRVNDCSYLFFIQLFWS